MARNLRMVRGRPRLRSQRLAGDLLWWWVDEKMMYHSSDRIHERRLQDLRQLSDAGNTHHTIMKDVLMTKNTWVKVKLCVVADSAAVATGSLVRCFEKDSSAPLYSFW